MCWFSHKKLENWLYNELICNSHGGLVLRWVIGVWLNKNLFSPSLLQEWVVGQKISSLRRIFSSYRVGWCTHLWSQPTYISQNSTPTMYCQGVLCTKPIFQSFVFTGLWAPEGAITWKLARKYKCSNHMPLLGGHEINNVMYNDVDGFN